MGFLGRLWMGTYSNVATNVELALSRVAPAYWSLSLSAHFFSNFTPLLWTYWATHRFLKGACFFIPGGFATSAPSAGMPFPPPFYKLTLTHSLRSSRALPPEVVTPSTTCFHTLQHFSHLCFHFLCSFSPFLPRSIVLFLDYMLEMLGNYKYLTYYYAAQSGYLGFLKTPRWF